MQFTDFKVIKNHEEVNIKDVKALSLMAVPNRAVISSTGKEFKSQFVMMACNNGTKIDKSRTSIDPSSFRRSMLKVSESKELDFYFVPNQFGAGFKKYSAPGVVLQNTIVIDIDCHESSVGSFLTCRNSNEFVHRLIDAYAAEYEIPLPNAIVFTGRGLHLYYCFKSCPKALFFVVDKVRESLFSSYEKILDKCIDLRLSLDKNVMSVNHFVRVPGTFNTKAGCYSDVRVLSSPWDNINSLKDELGIVITTTGRKQDLSYKPVTRRVTKKKNPACNRKRMRVFLSEYIFDNDIPITSREVCLHIYHCLCLNDFPDDNEQVLARVYELNRKFSSPLKNREIEALVKCDDKFGYLYTDKKICEKLGIDYELFLSFKEVKLKRNKNDKRNILTADKRNKEKEAVYYLYHKCKYNVTEIMKHTGHCRKTVNKYILEMEERNNISKTVKAVDQSYYTFSADLQDIDHAYSDIRAVSEEEESSFREIRKEAHLIFNKMYSVPFNSRDIRVVAASLRSFMGFLDSFMKIKKKYSPDFMSQSYSYLGRFYDLWKDIRLLDEAARAWDSGDFSKWSSLADEYILGKPERHRRRYSRSDKPRDSFMFESAIRRLSKTA